MAKFCSECGRPLTEGEVCNCVENVESADINVEEKSNVTEEKAIEENATADENVSTNANASADNSDTDSKQQDTFIEENPPQGTHAEEAVVIPPVIIDDNQSGNNRGQNFGNSNSNSKTQGTGNKWHEYRQNMHFDEEKKEKAKEEFEEKAKEFGSGLKGVLKHIIPMLKSPIKEIKNILNTDEKVGFYMIVMHVIVAVVAGVLAEETMLNSIMYSTFGYIFGYSLIKFAISVMVLVAIVDFLLAALMYFSTKVIFNYDTTYNKMMAIVGGMALTNAAALAAGAVVGIIFSGLGALIMLVGTAFSVLVLVLAYSDVVALDSDKKVFSLLITFSLLIIAVANIVYLVF